MKGGGWSYDVLSSGPFIERTDAGALSEFVIKISVKKRNSYISNSTGCAPITNRIIIFMGHR